MQLYFVRHGETAYNRKHKKMGQRIDIGLDQKGFEQAHEVIPKLPKDFVLIYSSPLKRAAETAKIIADYFDKDIQIRRELLERDFGSLSGKTWEEMEAETGRDLQKLDGALEYDYRPYGGESAEQVRERLKNFLEDLRSRHRDDKLVVVTHYGIIDLMNELYPSRENHRLINASVHRFDI
jgi:probable phosphoglycerate mutase